MFISQSKQLCRISPPRRKSSSHPSILNERVQRKTYTYTNAASLLGLFVGFFAVLLLLFNCSFLVLFLFVLHGIREFIFPFFVAVPCTAMRGDACFMFLLY